MTSTCVASSIQRAPGFRLLYETVARVVGLEAPAALEAVQDVPTGPEHRAEQSFHASRR